MTTSKLSYLRQRLTDINDNIKLLPNLKSNQKLRQKLRYQKFITEAHLLELTAIKQGKLFLDGIN